MGVKTSSSKEVYAFQISGTAHAKKHPQMKDEMAIIFSESKIGHVTCPHKDTMVITAKTDGYDMNIVFL